jgi:hypothetical protein
MNCPRCKTEVKILAFHPEPSLLQVRSDGQSIMYTDIHLMCECGEWVVYNQKQLDVNRKLF